MASSICSYMKNVKPNYKTRKQKKTKDLLTKSSNPSTTYGYFSLLPKEMRFQVFSTIPLADLGNLALTSRPLRDCVLEFIESKQGLEKILPSIAVSEESASHIEEVVLFDDAMKYTEHFGDLVGEKVGFEDTESSPLRMLKDTHSLLCSQFGSEFAYSCYGSFLRAFIAGWENDEKLRAYNAIKGASCLDERIEKVLNSSPGTYPWFEKYIRVFCREIFLNKALDDQDRGFWLSTILKPWPLVFQARLLYILYGPFYRDTGLINWVVMSTCPTFYGVDDIEIRDLAEALTLLHKECEKTWNDDDIISVIEELSVITNDWCLENTAKLLVMCGEEITYAVLGSKAVNGRVHELAYLGYYVTQLAGRYDMGRSKSKKLESFMGLIKKILTAMPGYKNKVSFTMSLFNVWEENIITLTEAIQEDTEREGSPEEQEQALIETVHNLSKVAAFLLKESIAK
ncbi:F-box only protein 47-like [Actinia tenebrosa]|uniref:F-box only protein 47-like n=1 Tax=Actinia tenebrosa TaxID=6105 RepID=A0A6P8J4N2_ACTTE|nr:F-box only protein 47-like [Actinia tenebrosa]